MNTPDLEELTKSIHIKNEEFCRKKYPEFSEYISNKYPDKTHIERLYLFSYPNCQRVCLTCGQKTRFINFNKGYSKYCCPGCASKSDDVKTKKIETCLEHYGVENPSMSKDIVQKKRDTMMDRYGVTNTSKLQRNREQTKQTVLSRYGVENAMLCDEVKNKIIQHNREKYGVDWPLSLDEIKKKADVTYKVRYGGRGNASQILKERAALTKLERYGDKDYSNREQAKQTMLSKYGSLVYHHYGPNKDTSIEVFVHDILKNNNIEYAINNRVILDGKELDVYIPSHKLAIEINGIYWHSDQKKDNQYHYRKFKTCQENGIQLLTIWEDQIKRNPLLVESIILSKLDIYKEKIYARKCSIREVSSMDSLSFLSRNHIQGAINSGIRLGLYYNDELVSLMTFGKRRKSLGQINKEGCWELYRYCNKQNTQVVGGASKLFSYFIDQYNPLEIESFSSNDISDGGLYKKLRFQCVGHSISYWYIKNYKRYHRFVFTKKRLIEMGYDENKTERQIMIENGYDRIYDSGQTKWIFCNKNL